MKQSAPDLIFIPNRSSDCLLGEAFGTLRPIFSARTSFETVCLLDLADRALLRSRGLLLAHEHQYELLLPGGVRHVQAGQISGGSVHEMPQGPTRTALEELSASQMLLHLTRFRQASRHVALLDEAGQIALGLRLIDVEGNDGGRGFIVSICEGDITDDRCVAFFNMLAELGSTHCGMGAFYRTTKASSEFAANPEIKLTDENSAYEVALELMRRNLALARGHERGVIEDIDTESLHDYRIALRKIRSVLSLFKGVLGEDDVQMLKKRFSALMARTGGLRDLDVFLLERHMVRDLVPEAFRDGLDEMFERVGNRREAEAVRLSDYLCSVGYLDEIKDLDRLLSGQPLLAKGKNADLPARSFICSQIWKRYKALCKLGFETGLNEADEKLHALRIQCKKLRYLMVFVASGFPKSDYHHLVKPVKRLLDALGRFNDCAVQISYLEQFIKTLEAEDGSGRRKEMQASIIVLIDALQMRKERRRAKIAKRFRQFKHGEAQKEYRKAFRFKSSFDANKD
ncbi:CHAD domain-containing protein [uncultured Cohaesibacter sp.]|uniref:CHAD domain-containing protein n=1 Tax=uncultured Cohaesibacter sp. TaxID=1002546 RepID=UPI00292F03AC|nr:CHAD domain-containing protein [uncultured Cohaesibacter sp.]